jgi:hypothetical protein
VQLVGWRRPSFWRGVYTEVASGLDVHAGEVGAHPPQLTPVDEVDVDGQDLSVGRKVLMTVAVTSEG